MDLTGRLSPEALFRPALSEIYRFLHVRSFCQVVKESHNSEGNVSVNFPRLTHKRFQLEIHSERHARKVSFQLFARSVRSRSPLLESIHQIKHVITVLLFSRGSTTKNPPIGSDGRIVESKGERFGDFHRTRSSLASSPIFAGNSR